MGLRATIPRGALVAEKGPFFTFGPIREDAIAAIATISSAGLIWLFSGGVLYTGGLIFYGWKKLPYNHAIWHLFVLGGSICHFFAIFYHVPGGTA